MKKILSVSLLFLICFSITSCAADYKIEWFDIKNVSKVERLDHERISIYTQEGFNPELGAIYTYNGEDLTTFDYTFILQVADGLYSGVPLYFDLPENPEVDAIDRNGNIIDSVPFSDEAKNMINIPGEKSVVSEKDFTEKGLHLNFTMGSFAIVTKDDKVGLSDLEGNMITGFDYHTYGSLLYPRPGKFFLENHEEWYRLMVDPYKKKIFPKVIRSFIEMSPHTFVYENERGKYALADYNSLELIDGEYDEFISLLHGSYTFLKEGKRYVTDRYGDVKYIGDEAVCGAFYDNYVIEENGKLGVCDTSFNMLVPCEYEDIAIIAKDLYILTKDDKSDLVRQRKTILSAESKMTAWENIIFSDEALYDFEGNFIIEHNWTYTALNGSELVIYDEETKRAGKLVSENRNPLVEIDDELLYSDTLPRIKNDITLIPLRAFAERTGFEAEYIENTKEIKLTSDNNEIIFKIGKKTAKADGKEISLEASPEIINNRTLVPARAVSDVFGYDISWDGEKRVVKIVTK